MAATEQKRVRLTGPQGTPQALNGRVFALTGGIGSGKSAASSILSRLGVTVVDADVLAREVVRAGSPALLEVEAAFGSSVLQATGELDRKALGARVFADPEARALLESILHPRIKKAAHEELLAAVKAGAALTCYEIPLLFETHQEKAYGPVVVVNAPLSLRIERIMKRDGLTEGAARARIDAQMPLEKKAQAADVVIENDSTLNELEVRTEVALDRVRALVRVL